MKENVYFSEEQIIAFKRELKERGKVHKINGQLMFEIEVFYVILIHCKTGYVRDDYNIVKDGIEEVLNAVEGKENISMLKFCQIYDFSPVKRSVILMQPWQHDILVKERDLYSLINNSLDNYPNVTRCAVAKSYLPNTNVYNFRVHTDFYDVA